MTPLEIILIIITIMLIIVIVNILYNSRIIYTDSDFKVISINRISSSKNEYVIESTRNGKYTLISTDEYHINERIYITSKKNSHY